ncbi:hypothetical protein ACGF4C_23605 [Streptomyces sp. NPDC048197]|uniref:hypothetical protein n=1 Tax=Streptomyces sp. NPDC048197 TaxID=3365511 RepID=UPI003721223F
MTRPSPGEGQGDQRGEQAAPEGELLGGPGGGGTGAEEFQEAPVGGRQLGQGGGRFTEIPAGEEGVPALSEQAAGEGFADLDGVAVGDADGAEDGGHGVQEQRRVGVPEQAAAQDEGEGHGENEGEGEEQRNGGEQRDGGGYEWGADGRC